MILFLYYLILPYIQFFCFLLLRKSYFPLCSVFSQFYFVFLLVVNSGLDSWPRKYFLISNFWTCFSWVFCFISCIYMFFKLKMSSFIVDLSFFSGYIERFCCFHYCYYYYSYCCWFLLLILFINYNYYYSRTLNYY